MSTTIRFTVPSTGAIIEHVASGGHSIFDNRFIPASVWRALADAEGLPGTPDQIATGLERGGIPYIETVEPDTYIQRGRVGIMRGVQAGNKTDYTVHEQVYFPIEIVTRYNLEAK